MTKAFTIFLWGIGFVIFLVSAWAAGSLILTPLMSWGNPHFVQWIGILVGLSIIVPAYRLFHLLEKIKIGMESSKLFFTLIFLIIWFLVPFFYGFNLDRLWCIEASVRGIELLPGRC